MSSFPIFSAWPWRMAWRDSRTHRRRMALFMSCILLGVASLVAVRSLGDNLERTVDEKARLLLGADLVLRSQRPFDDALNALIDSLGGEQSREVRFASMVYFPKNEGTRLVQVRALEGDFPYYGALETEPAEAAAQFQMDRTALLDETLLIQFGAVPGDSVRIGNHTFAIAGAIRKVPGEALAFATVAPRVYIPLSDLDRTGLIRFGSLASYAVYFKFAPDVNLTATERRVRDYRETENLNYETVPGRQRRLNRTLGNLYNFLSLVAFAALLLGCVGVASAIHVYMRQKRPTVAVLRCMGAQTNQIMVVYAIQAVGMGLIGAIGGAIIGLGVQYILPEVLDRFLPVSIDTSISWPAVFQGVGIGLGFSLLFALLPLLPVRHTSPLRTLRGSYEETKSRLDILQIAVALLIALLITWLAIAQTDNVRLGLGIAAGFFGAFALLIGMSLLLTKTVRRFFPSSWQYVWRQGLANLYRPDNQTAILMLALGLGTFLIATLYIAQHSLLAHIALAGDDNRPNMVLVDVQTDQIDGVADLVEAQGLHLIHRAPVVTMSLSRIKGQSIEDYRKSQDISRWALFREYRSSYRDHLFDSERLISGSWPDPAWNGGEPVPASFEVGIAQTLGVALGDTLVFDVQGVPVATVVRNLREVDWQRIQPNFFVVFPNGVLEAAPQFHVLTTHVATPETSAQLQRAMVRHFPNVSVVDLGQILQTIDEVLSQVAFVVRFMALFSVFTGLLVLAAAVTTSRYQRIREAVLLRTLGASGKQIRHILLLEYAFLGAMAALTGLVLAIGGAWALAFFVFDIAFALPASAMVAVLVLVTILTICVGMFNSRGIAARPPLEILRGET